MSRRKKKALDKSQLSPQKAEVVAAPRHWVPICILVLGGLLCHGIILTNDGTIWDSWYVKNWLQNKNWGAITEFFGSVGVPVYGWLYALFAYAPNIVETFMFATISCMVFSWIFTYLLALKLANLSSMEALCLALLAQSVPVFTAGQDLVVFFFVFMHALFLFAAYMATCAIEQSGCKALILRITSITLFFISFYNAALLVFYGGFFILLFYKWWRQAQGDLLKSIVQFSFRHLDFLLLPPIAWGFRQFFSPQFGWYADFNSPTANIPFILPSLKSFFVNVIPFHINQIWNWINENPVVILLLILLLFFAALRGPQKWSVMPSKIRTVAMSGFGILLLLLAIFPFAAAGKGFSPQPIGEPSRYTILTGLPLAILIFSVLRFVFLSRPNRSSRWLVPICFAISVVLGCQIPQVYIKERAEWIFSRSILQNAEKNDDIRKSSIIVLQNCGMTSEIVYGIYAFASVFGDFTRLVTPTVPQNGQFFMPSEILLTLLRTTNLPNMLNQINPSGRQTLVIAERVRGESSDWKLAMRYLQIKWFGQQEELSAFLGQLTNLKTILLKESTPLIPSRVEMELREDSRSIHKNFPGIEMVQISSDLWVSKAETTQEQYHKVMGSNPSLFVDPARPVERVTWNNAMEFCHRLNDIEKRQGRLPAGMSYRLPSLKEFQKFNANTPLSDSVLAGQAVFWQTQPACSRRANAFGLHDTTGNVWEWTSDWGDKSKKMKISTGGGFANSPEELAEHPQRNQAMDFFSRAIVKRLFGPARQDYPDQAFWDRGFRCVLSPTIPHQ